MTKSLGVLLAFCILCVGLSRIAWMDRDIWNLDEGSTFTMAHQVLEGDVLYRDAADNRSPLVPYLKAAVFVVFGDWNARAVHAALALMIGLTVFGLAWIGLRLRGWGMAWSTAVAAGFLQIFWIDVGDSMSANTEWFVIAFSTAAFALLVGSQDRLTRRGGLAVGLLFGGAILCKQPGLLDMLVAVVLLALLALSAPRERQRELWHFAILMVIGSLLPLGLFSAHYWIEGAWDDYVYYAFTFNTEVYIPEIPLGERMTAIYKPFEMAYRNAPLFGLLGVIAAIALLRRALPQIWRKEPIELLPWLILGWTASGLVSTTLSGRDFAHYSGQIIPGLSLAVGWLFLEIGRWQRANGKSIGIVIQRVLVLGLLLSIGFRIIQIRETIRGVDGSPHPLAVLAKQFSSPDEHLFVWGYFPEMYFFAERSPSTRFIYTNYLTGMIAWTNLDPLIDVEYGISPGAQEKFQTDFTDRPPSVIIDTNDLRGYARFPIEQREWLWPQIVENYAQVAAFSQELHRMRLFRRLDQLEPETDSLASQSQAELGLEISIYRDLRRNSRPMIEITGPIGTTRVKWMKGTQAIASLNHDNATPLHVRFFINGDPIEWGKIWALAQLDDGSWIRSAIFDFEDFVRNNGLQRPNRPAMQFETQKIPPLSVSSQKPHVTPYDLEQDLWSFAAPGHLRFACPNNVSQIQFTHGMASSAMFDSDGYDIAVYWIGTERDESMIWTRRMDPRRNGEDQFPQNETVELPNRGPGELEIRFTNGIRGDAMNDHVFFGGLLGFSEAPPLYIGRQVVSANQESTSEFVTGSDGHWLLHAPSRVTWDRPENLMEFTFTYGVDPGAYADETKGHSDGVGFELILESEDGSTIRLWHDTLRPFNHPEDRGDQLARVTLPQNGGGRLVLSTNPGDGNDTSWDWAYAGNFIGGTPGPPIKLSDGSVLASIKTSGFNDGWSDRQSEKNWGAQTPQELVYAKPADLSVMRLRFGITPEAARDDQGNRRSDGVMVRVLFRSKEGSEVLLFKRFLDPFAQPEDAGQHLAEFFTEPGREGTLHVRMEPGPSGNNSFDWAFWGPFDGDLAPPAVLW